MCFASISILNHIFVHMDHVHNTKTLQLSSSLLYNHSPFPIDHILMALVYSMAYILLVAVSSPNDDYIPLLDVEYIWLVLVSSPNDYHHISFLNHNVALPQTILLVLVFSILAHTLLASLSSILYNHELHLHNALNTLICPMTILS